MSFSEPNTQAGETAHWSLCLDCLGRGKKSKRIRKKAKLRYQRELAHFERHDRQGPVPVAPKGHLDNCASCHGTGLVQSPAPVPVDDRYPHVAIIGGGIAGVALAVACLHRGIPFTLFERDRCFDDRAQGYGLTLQQASRAIQGLGICSLRDGIVSTRHVVHGCDGTILGEWGIRKWQQQGNKGAPKRTNIHIARQSLRAALLAQLGDHPAVRWDHKLLAIKQDKQAGVDLQFEVDGQIEQAQADLVVGADGIRSTVRRLLIGDDASPLQYLGCLVVLGICQLKDIDLGDDDTRSPLLDAATVFQTANGNERIYIMPYKADSVMWQLSFPLPEEQAKALSAQGASALKAEALRRCPWHDPITQILTATPNALVSGYPVYDRALLDASLLSQIDQGTLIGDAAHPMSPFKGQGANQALLDALALARAITTSCRPLSHWREAGLRSRVLNDFEMEMLTRSAKKVEDSAHAADFLHSQSVLDEKDAPRGRGLSKD